MGFGTIWLVTLTIVMILAVRQIGLLSIKLATPGGVSPLTFDGPEVNSPIPQEVIAILPEVRWERRVLLVASSSCMPCRELMADLSQRTVPDNFIILLAGGEQTANAMAELFPATTRVVRDPQAGQVADLLRVHSTPFAVELTMGRITGKRYIRDLGDILAMLATHADDGGKKAQEVVQSAG